MMKQIISTLLKMFSLNWQDTDSAPVGAQEKAVPEPAAEATDAAMDENKPDNGAELSDEARRVQELEEKLSRTVESTQKRIDELTAKNRAQQEMLRERETKETTGKKLRSIDAGISRLEERMLACQEKIVQSKAGGNVEDEAAARAELKQLSTALLTVQKTKAGLEEEGRRRVAESYLNNAEQFASGLERALSRYPTLADGNGKLREDDPVVVRANELIAKDAAPSRRLFDFTNNAPLMINPRYDHVDGQYAAIRDAMDEIADMETSDIRKLRYEKNILSKRLIREKSKTFDPVHSQSQPVRSDSVSALRSQLDEAEKRGDVTAFQRLRTRIEEMERKAKE